MCTSHDHGGISRRGFATVAMAGAALSLLPFRAWAGQTEALSFMCIDYRLVDGAIAFYDRNPGPAHFDLVALAGASLAGVLTKFPEAVPGFWKQIDLALQLHHIRKVMVLDHMQCGAYAAQFNNGQPMPDAQERAAHRATMSQVKTAFYNRYPPSLGLEFFLMEVEDDKPGPINPVNV